MTADRCPDCGTSLAGHFRHTGPDTGRFLGCPARRLLAPVDLEAPRLCIREGYVGEARGRLYACWADCRQDDEVLVWDLSSGDQAWRGLAGWVGPKTRALTGDRLTAAVEQVEYELGRRVRIVKSLKRQAVAG